MNKGKINRPKTHKAKRISGFQVVENECIWMKAGVVSFHLCDHAYDCTNCPFDTGMQKAMKIRDGGEAGKGVPKWVEYLQQTYRGAARPCRHVLTGRVDAPKICTLNYECYHCSFDQMLDETDVFQEPAPPTYHLASGYKMADGYYYHMGHSWIRFEHGGRMRAGFDDFVIKLFGTMNAVNLPPLGEALKQHDVGWSFARGNHQAAVLSPASGTVLALNHKVREHPEIVSQDPYQEGWLMILEPTMPKRNLKGLYFGEQSFDWMEQEVQKLMGLLGKEYEKLAATGGEPIRDVTANISGISWDVLVNQFLGTEKIFSGD